MRTSSSPLTVGGKTHIQTDCTTPEHVEIVLDKDGKRVWINVEGICLLRICRAKQITLFDNRTPKLKRIDTAELDAAVEAVKHLAGRPSKYDR